MTPKKLPIAIAALCAMVFFAGCQSGAKTTTRVDVATDQSMQAEKTSADSQTTGSSSATNAAIAQAALKLNDPSQCDKIEDQTEKTKCNNTLNDQNNIAQAVAKTDASICKKMSSTDQQKACEINVETEIKVQEQAALRKKNIDNLYANQNKIVQAGDYTACKTLKDASVIIGCESTILTTKALQTGDVIWCDKISDSDAKSQCHKTSASAPKN